jgi:hypothetical protein
MTLHKTSLLRKTQLLPRTLPLLLALGVALAITPAPAQQPHKTRNVVIVMIDGMRWQEIFRGPDPELLKTLGPDVLGAPKERAAAAAQAYSRPTPAESRAALLPFLWTTVATQGQLFGNRDLGSDSHVTNPYNFSYPGYNETLTGFGDPRIDSNDNKPNPNQTVFTWLNAKPAFHGKAAAFGSWESFDGIFNKATCGFPVNSSYDLFTAMPATPQLELLNNLKRNDPRVWPDEIFDAPVYYTAVEYIKYAHPRLLFLGLGETDDWAHAGTYAMYLEAAHHADGYIADLWKLLQSLPEYRDQTTLIILPDHGRGNGPQWTDHGQKIPDSAQTWMAWIGPDTAAKGERGKGTVVTESQVAATLAALLGEDYHSANPKSGLPIQEVLPQ